MPKSNETEKRRMANIAVNFDGPNPRNARTFVPMHEVLHTSHAPLIADDPLETVQRARHLSNDRPDCVGVAQQIHRVQQRVGEAVRVPQSPECHCKAIHTVGAWAFQWFSNPYAPKGGNDSSFSVS